MRPSLLTALALTLVALTAGTASAAEEVAEDAVDAGDDWRWHRPVLIERDIERNIRRGPFQFRYMPLQAHTDQDGTTLAVWSLDDVKDDHRIQVFELDENYRAIDRHSVSIDRPRSRPVVAAGDEHLWYAHASAGDDGGLLLYKLTASAAEPIRIELPDAERTVSDIVTDGERLELIFIEQYGATDERNRLASIVSEDGGKTWSPPIPIGHLTSYEHLAVMPSVRTGKGVRARFTYDMRDDEPVVFRSQDDGRTWRRDSLRLTDKLAEDALRLPLQTHRLSDSWLLIYFVASEALEGGQFMLSHSTDAGQTWKPGTELPITRGMESPLGWWTTFAIDGDRMAFCHFGPDPDVAMDTEVVAKTLISTDEGDTWHPVDTRTTYRNEPTASLVCSKPGGGILFVSAVDLGKENTIPWHYLTVQEWSARPPEAMARPEPEEPEAEPEAGEEESTDAEQAAAARKRRQRINRLIDRLGAIEHAEREAATEALIEIGDPALESLEKARDSSDPEIADRAEKIIRAIKGVTEDHPDLGPAPEHPMVE